MSVLLPSNASFTVCDAGNAGFAFRSAGRGAALYNTAFRRPGFHDMAWDGPGSFRPISPSRESPPPVSYTHLTLPTILRV